MNLSMHQKTLFLGHKEKHLLGICALDRGYNKISLIRTVKKSFMMP